MELREYCFSSLLFVFVWVCLGMPPPRQSWKFTTGKGRHSKLWAAEKRPLSSGLRNWPCMLSSIIFICVCYSFFLCLAGTAFSNSPFLLCCDSLPVSIFPRDGNSATLAVPKTQRNIPKFLRGDLRLDLLPLYFKFFFRCLSLSLSDSFF